VVALSAVLAVATAESTTPSWDYTPTSVTNVCINATTTTPSGQQNARENAHGSPAHTLHAVLQAVGTGSRVDRLPPPLIDHLEARRRRPSLLGAMRRQDSLDGRGRSTATL
jgi:hypothetical protein